MSKTITDDQFWEQYKPVANHINEGQGFNDCLFETYGADEQYVKDVAKVNEAFVWTILDADNGLTITSGYHYVNRFGYLITELPCDEDYIDVILEQVTEDEE